LGSFHKELAEFLVESAENEELDGLDVIKALALKTQEFIEKLHSLQDEDQDGNKTISLEGLQQRQIPATMQQFLFAVAAAEGLTR
jgi:predicted glycosyltransferase